MGISNMRLFLSDLSSYGVVNIFVILNNEGKSVASFCHQVAACVPDMFWKFYEQKIAKNITTTKARETISTRLNPENFRNIFMYVWVNLKTLKLYLTKLATESYGQPSYLLCERSSFKSWKSWVFVVEMERNQP